MTFSRTILPLVLLGSTSVGLADEPRPAITLRLDHPDRQVRAVLDLFRGARVPHPAAALAAWKRASREPGRLGKPAEAVISAFNPSMSEELRTLDAAEFALWFEPDGGRPAWAAFLPGDDGSFAALATAAVLSGGAAEAPIDGLAVDRLGPLGSPLMARSPRALLVAGSPEGLKEAEARAGRTVAREPGDRLRFAVDPGSLDGSTSLLVRRLKVALGEARGPISGSAGLSRSTFTTTFDVDLEPPGNKAAVDPAWLEWLPAGRAMVAFSLAIDPSPTAWDAAFRLADRVERVDPVRANMAPIRLRLGLLARTLGLRVDGELLPHLRGISGWLGSDGRAADRAFLMLHLDDEAVAGKIFEGVKPLPNPGPPAELKAGSGRWLGRVEGRPLRLFRFGPSVVAAWGDDVVEPSIEAHDHPERSARPLFQGRRLDALPTIVAATWPARVPGLLPADSPLCAAVSEAPPFVWSGSWVGPGRFRVEGSWEGLDASARRFLDLIPLDPPPDH
jgi:hypothetical protein